MKKIKVGYNILTGKDIFKYKFDPVGSVDSNDAVDSNDFVDPNSLVDPAGSPSLQLFNSNDVIQGNPMSNVAIGFVYVWKTDFPPDYVKEFMQRISNYAAITGLWRTTNGGKYAFANILANPNINKLVLIVNDLEDNGHFLVDAVRCLWKDGVDGRGIVKKTKAANPRFEQIPLTAFDHLKKQVDLVIVKNVHAGDLNKVEELIKACYQEPENARSVEEFGLDAEFYSQGNLRLYDDGARESPLNIDLSASSQKISLKESGNISDVLGQGLQAENLIDALELLSSNVFAKGDKMQDQRTINMAEMRSISLTIKDVLEKIPEGYSEEYIKKYVGEFIDGTQDGSDIRYTYHDRIFKKWGNQAEKVVALLRQHPNTRRAVICLWDPATDLDSETPPCLDMIWCVVRNKRLEFHVVFRSHHLATITSQGQLMVGEGAFVPNMYAIGTLQQKMSDQLNLERGPVVLTDFSGHLYVA